MCFLFMCIFMYIYILEYIFWKAEIITSMCVPKLCVHLAV